MSASWKWKSWLFAGLVLFSFYIVTPTFLGFSEDTELPAYATFLPEKGINLGLDLRGGIYLEFDVELQRALEHRIDRIIDDLKRVFEEKGIFYSTITQDTASQTIVVTATNEPSAERIISEVRNIASDNLVQVGTLSFALSDNYKNDLKDQIVAQALEKVRNRIDRYGVAEPSIQRLGSDRISVELPGVKDPDRAISLIKKAGNLEFKMVDETFGAQKLTELIAKTRKEQSLAEDFSVTTAAKLTELLAKELPAETEVAFAVQYDPVARKIVGGTPYVLKRKAELTGEMLKDARTDIQNNEPFVSLSFDPQGTQNFGELTTKNVGKQLAILLDGVVNSAPVIQEPILGGEARITLGFGSFANLRKEADDLTLVLQEGALPAQLTEATKTVVGPSLGSDSIRSGVAATVFGAIIISLFMLIYYKGSGIIANIALLANLLFLLAAMALLQATLTLPGIAGIVLTLGMAIDANVLIFERIREEIRSGFEAKAAIDAGYGNAMRTIIDSNVTTLIAGIVLYQFGTGPIKGFAVTLILGLAISMYTACSCTRLVYDYFLIKKRITKVSI